MDRTSGSLHRRMRRALCLAAVSALAACMAPPPPPPPPPKVPPPPPPPKLTISIAAGRMVNPDINGRASPVILRIYELKSPAPFDGADFMSLYQQDRSVLGGELIAREELVMEPGQNQAISKLLAPEARVLGVIAIFRDVERARWRSSVTLVPGKDNALSVKMDDVTVTARPVR